MTTKLQVDKVSHLSTQISLLRQDIQTSNKQLILQFNILYITHRSPTDCLWKIQCKQLLRWAEIQPITSCFIALDKQINIQPSGYTISCKSTLANALSWIDYYTFFQIVAFFQTNCLRLKILQESFFGLAFYRLSKDYYSRN